MPSILFRICLLVCCLKVLFPSHVNAQDRCGTVEYNKHHLGSHDHGKEDFEEWLHSKILDKKTRAASNSRTTAGPYQVPVVVHIIHNGEAIGSGTNIPDAQVLSQIKVLNEDYQRTNADASSTQAAFQGVAAGMDIEFVLAKQDPEGLPTNGIVRVRGSRSEWTLSDNFELKAQSYWPAEDYLNIWVCNFSGDLVGYAQFPVSDLEGLEDSSNNRLTDGVVVWYRAFGSSDDGSFNLDPSFNKGRTTTHEVGHFLGLRHIWGDVSNCSGTDYIDDTPNQSGSTTGCPTGIRTSSCTPPTQVMYQNYMDYTNDACMNLFTRGQVDRMEAVIENSPRRESLLTSFGLQPPASVANNLGIKRIAAPGSIACSTEITPRLIVRNYGTNTVTQATLSYGLNGETVETRNISLNLAPLDSAEVTFSTVTIDRGTTSINFSITSVNNTTNSQARTNVSSTSVFVPQLIAAPFEETFNALPPNWSILNPDEVITWQLTTAPNANPANRALQLNFFDYEDKQGEIDIFLSPIIDLSTVPTSSLSFDVSYARFQNSNDGLRVIILEECESLLSGTTVYNKSGSALATATFSNSFVPRGASDWRRELVSLAAFSGRGKIQIAFVGVNDFGNNLYIDNIAVTTTGDIGIVSLERPALVTCQQVIQPTIVFRSDIALNSINIAYQLNNNSTSTATFNNIPRGESTLILPSVTLADGENTIRVSVNNPLGQDANPANDLLSQKVVLNQSRDLVPIRENFESDFSDWTIANPDEGVNWQTAATNFGQSIFFNARNDRDTGNISWFVSPVLDFTNAVSSATLVFDLSYRGRFSRRENLEVLVSTDCGNTYEQLGYDLPTVSSFETEWIPQLENDWESDQRIDLTAYAGLSDVRVAFVVTNNRGNNLYIDNIEFFVNRDPAEVEVASGYSVFGYDISNAENTNLQIGFNLETRQDVQFQIVDTMGKIVSEGFWSDVLNQVFPLPFANDPAAGLYFIRVRVNDQFSATRVVVRR